jgi:hypothetical protein
MTDPIRQKSWTTDMFLWCSVSSNQQLPAKTQERLTVVQCIVAESFSLSQDALVVIGAIVCGYFLPPFVLMGFIAHYFMPAEIDRVLHRLTRLFQVKDWGSLACAVAAGMYGFLNLPATLALGSFISGVKLHKVLCSRVGTFFNWR